ncbi:hypothetical protein Aduo_016163 [Ancylostoma duodenale]
MRNSKLQDDAKNPVLLLPKHPLSRMILEKYHRKLLHAGVSHTIVAVREKYIMPKLRQIAKSVLRQCVVCRKVQGRAFKYPEPPDFPSQRVTRSRPFQNIGSDYFGPLTVRSEKNNVYKIWVCLYTCMATRAIHLETVVDNSTVEFISAFRKFIARRGTPELVISDNAPTFKLGAEVLENEISKHENETLIRPLVTQEHIRWKFITPFSPWQGGFYERLLGSVKNALKKTIHKAFLTLRDFETILTEVEAVLNTRPLTPVNDSLIDGNVRILRPIDLINPYANLNPFAEKNTTTSLYLYHSSETKEYINSWFHSALDNLNLFWKLWQKDYLQALIEKQQRSEHSLHGCKSLPKNGDIVLVKQEITPRNQWPLAIITKIEVRENGTIRSAKIRTTNGTELDRPVNHLIPLEIQARESLPALRREKKQPPQRIQPTRAAKSAGRKESTRF